MCALKKPGLFKSVSAFSPIAHPCACPWGQKAFRGYLAGGVEEGSAYDASLLLAQAPGETGAFDDILVDVGTADCFLEEQLLVGALEEGAAAGACVCVCVCVRVPLAFLH